MRLCHSSMHHIFWWLYQLKFLGTEVDFRANLIMVLLVFKLDIIAQILYIPGTNGKPKGHSYYEQKTSEKEICNIQIVRKSHILSNRNFFIQEHT